MIENKLGIIQNSADGKIKIKRDLGKNYCRRPHLRERWKAREALCEEENTHTHKKMEGKMRKGQSCLYLMDNVGQLVKCATAIFSCVDHYTVSKSK